MFKYMQYAHNFQTNACGKYKNRYPKTPSKLLSKRLSSTAGLILSKNYLQFCDLTGIIERNSQLKTF